MSGPRTDALLHFDDEAEKAVLGCLLTPSNNGSRDSKGLKAEDFYSLAHVLIFRAHRELSDLNMPVNAITVNDWLLEKGLLEEAGGRAFVFSLASAVYPVTTLSSHIDIVRRHAHRREEVRIARALEAGELDRGGARDALDALNAPNEGSGPRLRFQTAQELAETVGDKEPETIVDRLLYRGGVHNVTAKPKEGKSTFIMSAVKVVIEGGEFLGLPTTKTPVVYLTEERCPTFTDLLKRVGLFGHPDLHILFRQDASDLPWDEVMAQATAHAIKMGAGLLIVDTLFDWSGTASSNENQAGDGLTAMRPLQKAAAADLCVVDARHDNKIGQRQSLQDSGRGSNAFNGVADVIMRLLPVNKHDYQRVLEVEGRFNSLLPKKTVLEWRSGVYVSLGEPGSGSVKSQSRILDVLSSSPQALSKKDLQAEIERTGTKVSDTALNTALGSLEASGRVCRIGEGRRGSPYLYLVPDEHSGDVSNT